VSADVIGHIGLGKDFGYIGFEELLKELLGFDFRETVGDFDNFLFFF
jgi:hypothetical protein